MVLLEKLKDEIEILPTNREDIHPIILKHYLQKWPIHVSNIYGVYHKTSEGRELIGMAIYGYPIESAVNSLNANIHRDEVLELKRLFIEDIPSLPHIESYVIAKTLKMIKQEMPTVKVVITFADNKQGHLGTIYQATNAIYLGKSSGQLHKYAYILRGNLNNLRSRLKAKSYPKEN